MMMMLTTMMVKMMMCYNNSAARVLRDLEVGVRAEDLGGGGGLTRLLVGLHHPVHYHVLSFLCVAI